jgi:hypothetical protein
MTEAMKFIVVGVPWMLGAWLIFSWALDAICWLVGTLWIGCKARRGSRGVALKGEK